MKNILVISCILITITATDFFYGNTFTTLAAETEELHQSGITPELRRRLETIHQRIHYLGEDVIAFWKSNGPDKEHGGFYGRLDRTGKHIPSADKSLIQQVRHLCAFSLWYRFREKTPEIKSIADNLYAFIIPHFYDSENKDFFYKVTHNGILRDSRKMLYAESFAIYCLSEYAISFNNMEAADYALNCFRSIDKRLHDSVNGGYDQSNDPRGLPEGVAKETNTHMHLLESFASLYEATGDILVKQRLEELLNVFMKKILQPGNYCHTVFSLNWTPIDRPVIEYGHDLQTAWLMMNAARVLGRMNDPAIIKVVLAMGLNSSEKGLDSEKGGYFYAGEPAGKITENHKEWWVEAESLSGLWWMYQLTGDTVQLDYLERTVDWIENYQRDSEYGEWFARINADNSISGGDYKGSEWKTSYHTTRALVFVNRWISNHLK